MINLDSLLNISPRLAKMAILYFWAFIFIVPFHLLLLEASKTKLFPHLSFIEFTWMAWNSTCSCILTTRRTGEIFLILAAFWLRERGPFCDFRAFSWEHNGGMASNHCHHLQNRLHFVQSLLILVKQFKFGVSGIFVRTHGKNGLKFDMLMYLDHL